MARVCIFCPKEARSAEHLFSDWLNQPGIFTFDKASANDTPLLSRHIANEEGVTEHTWSAPALASATTRKVCHGCNTGWMAKLEREAKPVLLPLIQGKATTIGPPEEILIATWATKTAIVLDATLSKEEDRFPKPEAEIVREQLRPPASFNVFVAAIFGRIPPMHYNAARVRMTVNGNETFQFHFHTVQVGCVVVQIMRREPPPTDYGALHRLVVPTQIELPFDIATCIFPPTPKCPWPPPKVLGWDALERFSTRNVPTPDEWQLLDLDRHVTTDGAQAPSEG